MLASKKIKLRHSLGLTVAILGALVFAGNAQVGAAPADRYPDDGNPNHWVTVSRAGNGINLHAPWAYLKVKFDANTHYYNFYIENGCYFNDTPGSVDAGSATRGCTPGDTDFSICPIDSGGNVLLGDCYTRDPASWGADGRGTRHLRFRRAGSSGTATEMNMPVTTDSAGNDFRYFMVIANMNPSTGGGSNGFRLRTEATNQNGTTGGRNSYIGVAGEAAFPISLGLLPMDSNVSSDRFEFNFQVPCSPATRNSFTLRWYDADRGSAGIPQDDNISWSIINVNTGEQRNASDFTSNITAFLGGNLSTRSVTVSNSGSMRVAPGDQFRFVWTGVRGNNGVQTYIPFDEVDAGVGCVSGCTSARVRNVTGTVDSSPTGSVTLNAGEEFNARFEVINRSSANYPENGSVIRLGYDSAGGPSGGWGTSSTSHTRVRFDLDIPPGATRVVAAPNAYQPTTNFRAPSPSVQTTYTFTWRLVRTSGSTTWFGESCSVSITVRAASVVGCSGPGEAEVGEDVTFNVTPVGSPAQDWDAAGGDPASGNSTSFTTHFDSPGQYTVEVAGGGVGRECSINVGNRSYLKNYGGEVMSGGVFDGGGVACGSALTDGGIHTWAESASGYRGSSSNLTVSSLMQINETGRRGFFSASLRPEQPKGLTFANNDGSTYGGNSRTSACLTDFYNDTGRTLSSTVSGNPPSSLTNVGIQRYSITGDTTLNATNLIGDSQVAVYVSGDVFINGPITTTLVPGQPNAWADQPYFVLVAAGDIYIGGGVSRLDGMYIAQGKTIYTCAAGIRNPYNDLNRHDSCDSQLTVNGGLIANTVKFLRSFGTLRDGTTNETPNSTNIAEIVNYTPEMWVTPSPLLDPRESETANDNFRSTFDSIRSLPPVY